MLSQVNSMLKIENAVFVSELSACVCKIDASLFFLFDSRTCSLSVIISVSLYGEHGPETRVCTHDSDVSHEGDYMTRVYLRYAVTHRHKHVLPVSKAKPRKITLCQPVLNTRTWAWLEASCCCNLLIGILCAYTLITHISWPCFTQLSETHHSQLDKLQHSLTNSDIQGRKHCLSLCKVRWLHVCTLKFQSFWSPVQSIANCSDWTWRWMWTSCISLHIIPGLKLWLTSDLCQLSA